MTALTITLVEHISSPVLVGVILGGDKGIVARQIIVIASAPLAIFQIWVLHVHVQSGLLLHVLLIDLNLLLLCGDALVLHTALAVVVPALHAPLHVLAFVEVDRADEPGSVVLAIRARSVGLL